MKYFVFISVFFLFGCKPFSLEEDEFGEPRVTDDVIGETDFEIPDIKDIGLNEIRKNKDECKNYENHSSKSVLYGDKSIVNEVINCIAYNIDKGVKPLCELEKSVKAEYDRTRDDRKKEELEIVLNQIEVEKDIFVESLEDIYEPAHKLCKSIEGSIGNKIKKDANKNFKFILDSVADFTINTECKRLYRVVDSKAALVCIDLNFPD